MEREMEALLALHPRIATGRPTPKSHVGQVRSLAEGGFRVGYPNQPHMSFASTILFASERGANLGHLGRDLALARAFKSRGHRVVLAVPDIRAASGFLVQEEFTLLQASALRPSTLSREPSINFADMLLNLGFADAVELTAAIDAWLALIELTSPAMVVDNNSPTALIAARFAQHGDNICHPIKNGNHGNI